MPRKHPKSNGEAQGIADPFPDRTGTTNSTLPPGTSLAEGSRQLRPVLTLFAARASYVLRLDDISFTPMALAVAREIKSGSLIVMTPTDTRVFELSPISPRSEPAPSPSPPAPVTARSMEQEAYVQGEPELEEEPAEIIAPEFQEPRVRHREHTPLPDNSVCGRCNGTGQTMAGGGCPVCGGRGTIIAWGRPRSQ